MNNSIDKFISYLYSNDKPEARTIRNIWIPNSKKGQISKLETEVVDFLEIGETKNLIVVGIVILKNDIHEDIVLHHLAIIIDFDLPLSF